MSYRKSFTIIDNDIFIFVIVVVDRQILKIRGDVMGGTRVHNPIGLASSWCSYEIRLRPL